MDGIPNYVGATIHGLFKGLDKGDMLFYSLSGEQSRTLFELVLVKLFSCLNKFPCYL